MKKRRYRPNVGKVRVGLGWFDREQWHLLRDVAADRDELDDSFEQWEASARKALANFKSQGVLVEPFKVCVEDLVRWCAERNLPLNGASRAEYVSFMLRRKHAGA